jgi:DNA-binding CsgD family transcriptional regulator
MDEFCHHQLEAQRNWAVALETYRTALAAYRRLLGIRVGRDSPRTPLASHMLPGRPSQPLAHPSPLAGLTAREREVADLVARGYSNQQIADALVLTRGTVANHVAHILAKLGAANRTQVAAWVLDRTAVGTDEGALRAVSAAVSPAPIHFHRSQHRVSTPAD